MAGKKQNADVAITRLGNAARSARTHLAERLLAHGFYAGQDQIMLALGRDEGMTPGQLATRIGVRPPTVTKTINRLQEQGFVERKPSEVDARQSHIFLTDSGRAAIASIERAIRKTEKKALAGLKKKDRKRLSNILQRIETNLATGEDQPST